MGHNTIESVIRDRLSYVIQDTVVAGCLEPTYKQIFTKTEGK